MADSMTTAKRIDAMMMLGTGNHSESLPGSIDEKGSNGKVHEYKSRESRTADTMAVEANIYSQPITRLSAHRTAIDVPSSSSSSSEP